MTAEIGLYEDRYMGRYPSIIIPSIISKNGMIHNIEALILKP